VGINYNVNEEKEKIMKYAEKKNQTVYRGDPNFKPSEKRKYVAFVHLKDLKEKGFTTVICKRLPKSHFAQNKRIHILNVSSTRAGLVGCGTEVSCVDGEFVECGACNK